VPVVIGDLLPFLPRVSVITFTYFIYPFIGYAYFSLSLYVRLLHVILSVVVFPPRASSINQPKALTGGEAYHIDTYEQMALRLAGPIEVLWGVGGATVPRVRGCEGDGSFVLLTAASAAGGEFFLPPRSLRYALSV
jgi:hypothetical protein